LVKVQQSPYTDDELLQILEKVNSAAKDTKVPFESGADPRTAKVNIYTPEPDKLRTNLEEQNKIPDYMDDILFIFQESLSGPLALKYPYLLGGNPIADCTTGFAVKRNNDDRRFMTTAGHCNNNNYIVYSGVNSVYLGPTTAYDIYSSVGDIQMHDVSVRSLDLTNEIFVAQTTTNRVTGTETKATTLSDYVCKYGRTTGNTCGYVTSISYAGGNYVRVDRPTGVNINIACEGDSGAPVYKPISGSTVTAVGVLSSGWPGPACTTGSFIYFTYTPVDTINNAGFTVLTSHYQQRYHQNVFFSNGTCTEYVTPYDNNGYTTPPYNQYTCSTTPPGTGTIETYTAWVLGNYWFEAMWRDGIGYTRRAPLNGNGTINWSLAIPWVACCWGTAPRSQDAYIVGNNYYQNVFWTETNCTEYLRPLDNNGNLGTQTSQNCRTSVPAGSSGTITSYTAYVVGGRLREGIWRGGIGYVRDVPLTSTNQDIDWGNAPAQGGDILSYP
jgi:hypothetical protein